jgi:CheY-like chemotaxis protein
MAPRRILLTDGESPLREALARALSSEGHEVQVSDASEVVDRSREFGPDLVVGTEEAVLTLGQRTRVPVVTLSRPVNMEELRRTLRDM